MIQGISKWLSIISLNFKCWLFRCCWKEDIFWKICHFFLVKKWFSQPYPLLPQDSDFVQQHVFIALIEKQSAPWSLKLAYLNENVRDLGNFCTGVQIPISLRPFGKYSAVRVEKEGGSTSINYERRPPTSVVLTK